MTPTVQDLEQVVQLLRSVTGEDALEKGDAGVVKQACRSVAPMLEEMARRMRKERGAYEGRVARLLAGESDV